MMAFFPGWQWDLPESFHNCCEGNGAANYHWLNDQMFVWVYMYTDVTLGTKAKYHRNNSEFTGTALLFANVCQIIDSLTFVFANPNHDRSPPQATSRELDKRYNGADPSTQRWIHETTKTPVIDDIALCQGRSIVCNKCKSATPKERKRCASL